MSTATRPSTRPRAHAAGPVAPLVVGVSAVVAVLLGVVVTGATIPLLIGDPGPLVRWALPVVTTITNLASVTTVGLVGMAAFAIPERARTDRLATAGRYAALAGLVWFAAGGLALLLSFADIAGLPLTDPAYASQLGPYLFSLEVTRVEAISVGLGLVTATGAFVARSRATFAWLFLIGLVGTVVLALTGHAAGSVGHEDAVNAMGFHLLGVTAWVGGLIALVLMRPHLGRDLGAVVGRFSLVATWAFVAVALSGLQSGLQRVDSLDQLASGYGALLIGKAVLLAMLGVVGWQQRRRVTVRLDADSRDGRAFAALALGEVAVMGLAMGLAVALSRSESPNLVLLPQDDSVLALTDYPDPGPMAWSDWFLTWRIDWLFLVLALVAMGLYAAGVMRLRRRGDAWPWLRTAAWMVGWLVFIWATCAGPGIWARILFSVHMVMHMVVAMIVPLFLVPAAPVTLALRSLPARPDKTWGPRELVLHVSHSRLMRALANPVVAAALFFVSLAIFYYSPAFELALTTHTGHLLMMGHFLLTGYLFTWVLVGIDPGPKRYPPLLLLVVLFITISFHAFFGVILTGSEQLLAPGFFGQLTVPWMTDPLGDQVRAGEIAWGVGEAPTLVLALMVARNWVRSDAAATRRQDRQADRDGDAELAAYNAMLSQRAGSAHGAPDLDRRQRSPR